MTSPSCPGESGAWSHAPRPRRRSRLSEVPGQNLLWEPPPATRARACAHAQAQSAPPAPHVCTIPSTTARKPRTLAWLGSALLAEDPEVWRAPGNEEGAPAESSAPSGAAACGPGPERGGKPPGSSPPRRAWLPGHTGGRGMGRRIGAWVRAEVPQQAHHICAEWGMQ